MPYINVTKPTDNSYTKVTKGSADTPLYGTAIYGTNRYGISSNYVNVSKPVSSTYTKVTKPT